MLQLFEQLLIRAVYLHRMRTEQLLGIRSKIDKALVSDQTSFDEQFQNQTLRPILKFQHHLLIIVFENHIQKYKVPFATFSKDKKTEYVEYTIQKDKRLRSLIKGLVVGLFTIEEYNAYAERATELDKRMMTMLIQRINSEY